MSTVNSNDTSVGIYTLIVGFAYLMVGCAQFVNGFIGIESLFIPGDIFQGAVIAIIGTVFVKGFVEKNRNDSEWKSYLSVGSLLAGIIFALFFFMLISNGLGWALGFEDWLEWTPMEHFQPGLWLFLIALPGVYLTHKTFKKELR